MAADMTAQPAEALFRADEPMTAERTLALYEAFYAQNGPEIPAGNPDTMRFVENLSDSLDGIEGLILDSYGVIGLGTAPIEGITDLFAKAEAKQIPIVILTNGASQPAEMRVQGYQNWGLNVTKQDIISSRDACHLCLQRLKAQNPQARFSYLSHAVSAFEDVPGVIYGEADYQAKGWAQADYFVFLGAIGWSEQNQDELEQVLKKTGGALIIGNPDVSAPVTNAFTFEPGYWAMKAQRQTGAELIMTGKPYGEAFEIAFQALEKKAGKSLSKQKVAMVGDSLHTDILGAKDFGLSAILLSGYGLLARQDVKAQIKRYDIYPDMIATYL